MLMRAVFYSSESGEELSIDSLDIYGLNIPDSVICSMSTLKNIDIPLNSSTSNCSFVIINGGRADTIEIIMNQVLSCFPVPVGIFTSMNLKKYYILRMI